MNLMLSDILAISALVIAVAIWWHGQGIKARALSHVRRYCQQHELQFLDDSLVWRKMRPVQTRTGSWLWQRTYGFEFTSTGEHRYRGDVVMQGAWLEKVITQTYHLG